MALSKIVNGGVAASGIPSGGIIQVQYTQYTSTTNTACANDTNQALSHLSVNITPISTNSIIKLEAQVVGEWSVATSTYNSTWFFNRDSTRLGHATAGDRNVGILMGSMINVGGTDADTTAEAVIYSYMDIPSTTSQITYTVATRQAAGSSSTWYTNRTVSDTDYNSRERGVSFIRATEIAG
tara:strand:+ start:155 stop:700 length:546 start_codon:yes stop_codon:yes gene_type:complete